MRHIFFVLLALASVTQAQDFRRVERSVVRQRGARLQRQNVRVERIRVEQIQVTPQRVIVAAPQAFYLPTQSIQAFSGCGHQQLNQQRYTAPQAFSSGCQAFFRSH